MKNFIKILFQLFYSLFFIVLGLVILDVYFQYVISYDSVIQKIDYFLGDKFAIFLTGALFIAIPFVYILACLFGGRKESYLRYKTSEGDILISIYAVEDFIKKTAKSFREVKDAYPTITLKGKETIDVSIKLKIWSGMQNLPMLLEEIQKEIRSHLQNMIGIEGVQGVNIFLAKDSFAHRDIIQRNRKNLIQPENKSCPMPIVSENTQNKEQTDTDEENSYHKNEEQDNF